MSLRKQPITPEKLKAIGESYRLQYILCRLQDIEYSQFLDVNFRSPIIHNHIRRAQESIKAVYNHTSVAVDNKAQDNVLDAMCDLHSIIKMLCCLDNNQIKDVAEGMSKLMFKTPGISIK